MLKAADWLYDFFFFLSEHEVIAEFDRGGNSIQKVPISVI